MKRYLITASLLFILFCAKAQSKNDLLYRAVANKDTTAVKQLLDSGADANYKPKMGKAEIVLLVNAIINHDIVSVRSLVEHRADVNARDWFRSTPLMYAAQSGDLDIVKYLIAKGADVKATDGQGNSVLSAAKESNDAAMVKLIEEAIVAH